MYAQQFEPMTVGQILDRTFRLYRSNFVRFIAIIAVIYVPITLISIVAMTLVTGTVADFVESAREAGEAGEAPEHFDPAMFVPLIVTGLVAAFMFVLAQVLCNAALIKSVSESYLGNEVTVGQAYRAVLPRLGSIIGAGILVGIVTMIGFVLCVVPGIIFWLWFILTTQVIVVERIGATRGMSRSKALVSGNLGKAFGLLFVVGIISYVVSLLFQQIGGLVAGTPAPGDLTTPIIINQLFSMAGQVLAMPIAAGAFILLYYDLRIRKEGFDLQMLAQSLGSGGPPQDGLPPVQC